MAQALDIAGYELTNVGLVFKRALADKEYLALGRKLATMSTATVWSIGDWLVASAGRTSVGNAYEAAHGWTGKSYETLSQYARVSAAYAHHDRDPRVPWSFYREALRLPTRDRVTTISLAIANKWNRAGLTDFINTRLDKNNALDSGAHSSGKLTKGGRVGWRGRNQGVAPKQVVRCPHCGGRFEVRRKGLTDAPIEPTAARSAVGG